MPIYVIPILLLFQVGPIFTPLPKSVLGAIVMWSSVYLCHNQFKRIPQFIGVSFQYFFIWLSTIVTTVVVDITFGVVLGAILSLRYILYTLNPDFNKRKTDIETRDT